MLKEPYNFTLEDLDENKNDMEENEYEYGSGGLCKLDVNEHIKKYTTNKLIGEGSYASVWEVYKTDKTDKYAIKISKSNKKDSGIGENEISILRKLNGSNYILDLKEYFILKKNGEKYLCMVVENLGFDLHILKRLFRTTYSEESNLNDSSEEDNIIMRCLPMSLTKKITYQILEGLKHIHSRNIIHTDIKLDNVLITNHIENIKTNKDINIKICDFGTSHLISNKCTFGIGTIDYSAPECIIGYPYGTGIDIWALGCIIFELVTGVCLFDYSRYYEDASQGSSGFSTESYENENDKTQIEFLLLCMMKVILGGFPSKVFKKGKYYDNYFDYKGRLRFKPLFLEDEGEIINVLIDEFKFEKNEASELNNFLVKLLCIDPNKRANVNDLLNLEWLQDKSD